MQIAPCDIHNHLLPGVDDGFQHPSHALAAIRRMAEAGCRELVFTPHLNPDVDPHMTEARLREAYGTFAPQIPAEWGMATSLAAEYMVVKDFEQRADDSSLLTYPDGSILIEMSYFFGSENLEETVFALNMAGRKPILAHPERYLYLADSLKTFNQLRDMGCRMQLNCMSLTGVYGPASLKILNYLLDNAMYSFIATDLHTMTQLERILSARPDRKLRKAVEKLIANSSYPISNVSPLFSRSSTH